MRVQKILIVAFLLLGTVTWYVCAGNALAGAAQTTSAGSVTITDSAISPTMVTILAGGSVLWTNRGTLLHKIVSSSDRFGAFQLTTAQSHRVPFPLPGAYTYTVDAVIKGVVIVIAGGGSGAAAPPPTTSTTSTGENYCGHPTIYHYDIRVDVHRYEETSWVDRTGTRLSVSDWKASWPNAPLSVVRCGGSLTMVIPAGMVGPDSEHGLTTGQFIRKFDWNDTTSVSNVIPGDPPCHFTITNTVPAMTSLLTEWYVGSGGGNFTFYAQAVHNDPDPTREEMHALLSQCDGRPGHRELLGGWSEGESTMGNSAPLKPVEGVDYAITDRNLVLTLPDVKYKQIPFPLADLAAGKRFIFDTGIEKARIANAYGSDAINDRAVVTFSPVQQ
jgi:plastocyanin